MYLQHNRWLKRYVLFYYLGKSLYHYKIFDPKTKEWSYMYCQKKSVWVMRINLYKLTPEEKLELL